MALSSGELDGMPEGAQLLGDALPVIALDLDDAVFHGAARAAEALELGGERVEGGAARAQAVNHRDDLAAAITAVARDAHDAVVGRTMAGDGRGGTRRGRHARSAPSVGGVDEPAPRHGA